MYKYEYKDPKEQGARQVFLTKKEHNSLFEYRQKRWFHKHRYFLFEDHFYVEEHSNLLAKIAVTMYLPISIFMYGFIDVWEDYKKLMSQKKNGSFLSYSIHKKDSSKLWFRLSFILRKKGLQGFNF